MTDVQRVALDRVPEALDRIVGWAKRGTLHQFYNEMNAKLAENETYCVEMQDDVVVFSRVEHEGGFLGIGVRTVKEPVLEVRKEAGLVVIPDESLDAEFAIALAALLEQH
jgi:hypothetical protein